MCLCVNNNSNTQVSSVFMLVNWLRHTSEVLLRVPDCSQPSLDGSVKLPAFQVFPIFPTPHVTLGSVFLFIFDEKWQIR